MKKNQKIKQFIQNFFFPAALVFTFVSKPVFAEWDSSSLSYFGLPDDDFETILLRLLNYLLSIVGIGGVIGFVAAGIMYLTAAGEEKRIQNAKSIMLFSIVGVVVAVIGLIVVSAIAGIFIDGDDNAFTLLLPEGAVGRFF